MKKEILVIDDDNLVLKAIKKLLSKRGYSVVVFSNPKKAMNQIINKNFDLILCDIRMPEINGIDLISLAGERRKKEAKPAVPVIFMTGYASCETFARALKLEAKDYIYKPFDIDKLLRAIKGALEGRNSYCC